MKKLRLVVGTLALLVALGLTPGCDSGSQPPAVLTVEQLPAALEKAYKKAKPEIKDLATQTIALVQAQDYVKAIGSLRDLAAKSSLTKEQTSVTTSAILTVNGLLEAAQSKGDAQAAQTLKAYRHDK